MDRYTSQIAFLGKKAHEHLSKSTVAVIGLGALGSVAAELLARAGIGTIILIDHEQVLPRKKNSLGARRCCRFDWNNPSNNQ